MSENSENNRRIARNTLFLYGRMLFSMIVSLYTTRVVLQTLGEVDFGLYNAIGGFVVMFSIIAGSLSSSVSRFLTFELGRGDHEKLKHVFSTSLVIHISLAVIITLGLETLGLWFLNHKMTIPEDRILAANWVFHSSVGSFVIGIIGVTYTALITAHERMNVYAYIGIAQVLLHLIAVLFLAFSPMRQDNLALYAILNFVIALLLQIYTWSYCKRNFKEARLERSFDRTLFHHIGSFAGWNFIGSLAGMLKDQGVNLLLNLYGGPTVNAARGIGGNINGAVTKFSSSFMTAMNPQIIKSYAIGDFKYLFTLVERGSRFAYYAMLVLALPVIIETDTILTLWLGAYPEHTVNFARLFLVLTMVDILSSTLMTVQSATGKIKKYQIVVGGALLLNFPISYFALVMGAEPETTMFIAIGVALLCLCLRLIFLKNMVGISIPGFFKRVILNVTFVTIISSLFSLLLYELFLNSYPYTRLAIVTGGSILFSSAIIFFVGCTKVERSFILKKSRQFISKFF